MEKTKLYLVMLFIAAFSITFQSCEKEVENIVTTEQSVLKSKPPAPTITSSLGTQPFNACAEDGMYGNFSVETGYDHYQWKVEGDDDYSFYYGNSTTRTPRIYFYEDDEISGITQYFYVRARVQNLYHTWSDWSQVYNVVPIIGSAAAPTFDESVYYCTHGEENWVQVEVYYDGWWETECKVTTYGQDVTATALYYPPWHNGYGGWFLSFINPSPYYGYRLQMRNRSQCDEVWSAWSQVEIVVD